MLQSFLDLFTPQSFLAKYLAGKVTIQGEPDNREVHIPQFDRIDGSALPDKVIPRPSKEELEEYLSMRIETLALTKAEAVTIENEEIPALRELLLHY